MKVLIWLYLLLVPAVGEARVPAPAEVYQAALHHAAIGPDLDRWSSRSRLAGLIPVVDVEAKYRSTRNADDRMKEQLARVDESFEFKSAQTDTLDGMDEQWSVSLNLKFDLQRVVFDRDELAADESARRNLQLRNDVADQALTLFYSWLESSRRAATSPHEERVRFAESRDLAAARLDALTGGWFARTIAEEAL